MAVDLKKYAIGIELGSTRIKAVLIDERFKPAASGIYNWENRFEGGFWTYSLDDVWKGTQAAFASLSDDFVVKFGEPLTTAGAMGVSAMMHGYLVFDKNDGLLAPFRTWRNTNTGAAAEKLTKAFEFNVPQRWSAAHLYQAILDGESHVKDAAFLTTLAGYVHWKLTGEKVLGVGDVSGMFPVDGLEYNSRMLETFNNLTGMDITPLLPAIKTAGEEAGVLTEEGAKLLDPTGVFQPGIPLCPPEGDAGTGMVATNSVKPRTGNVSAGTSVFAMAVLEKPLISVHEEIDLVTTPDGKPVAMVHCNNCTSDIDAWVGLFTETGLDKGAAYELFFRRALEGEPDCGGLLSYNYLSGEPIAGLTEGRPLFARMPNARFSLANFCRCLLYSALATLKIGMDILTREGVTLERICGHGGLYKTTDAGQKITAAALNVPVTVTELAGEGGAWGMALLAAFAGGNNDLTLADFLDKRVFGGDTGSTSAPDERGAAGFSAYMERFAAGLEAERAAVKHMR
ncbi:MAG: ATPase [Clostridiales bacterium]|jgi:sugar (pentulose or hexulose) kinase|nr:ATPase [Clostridiales bacterium]